MKNKIALAIIVSAMAIPLFGISACSVVYDAPIENVTIVSNSERFTLTQSVRQTGKDTLKVQLAKNEYEGMQFILNFDYDIKNASVEVSEIKDNNNNILTLHGYYREHYITNGSENKYADALIPLCYDASRFFDIKAGENQGIWLTVKSNKDQPAGMYYGSVKVTHDNGVIEIPIEVEIWDFAIPTTPSNQSSFELWFGSTWRQYVKNNATASTDYYSMYQKYYWFLSDYRLIAPSIPEPYSTPEQFADLVEKYLSDERINVYRIPMGTNNHDANGVLNTNYQKYIDVLDERGLLPYGFTYTYDEPSREMYNTITSDFKAVERYNPNVRQLLTVSPRTSFFDTVNLWCSIWSTDNHNEWFVRDMQDMGDEFWWYGCIIPSNPYPSFALADDLMSMRLVEWMQKDWNVTGQLYWASGIMDHWTRETGWDNPRDIWNDAMTIYKAGDGYLFYAGTENDGVVNTNTPIPSIRLENIRAGQEDYEYLVLMQNKVQSLLDKYTITEITVDKYMDTYYSALYNSMGDFNTNSSEMQKTRARLAHDIMTTDDAIVSVLAAMTETNSNMREIRVFAPSGSVVKIDGQIISGVDKGLYSIYSKSFALTSEPFNMDVFVNGEKYERTLAPIPEAEYRDLAYECAVEDAKELGIPLTSADVHKKVEQNCFNFYNVNENGKEVQKVVANREDLSKIKYSIAKHMNNTFPLVVMNIEDKIKPEQTLYLYVQKGASVSVEKNSAELVESGEKYSLYKYVISFDKAGRQLVNIDVSLNGVTQTFSEIVFQQYIKAVNLIDFSDPVTQSTLNSLDNIKIINTDNGPAAQINVEKISSRGVKLPVSVFADGIKTCSGYTNIIFDITNNSDKLINLPEISLICGMDFDITPVYGMVRPGDTITVCAQIPEKSIGLDISSIRFRYSDLSTAGTFSVSGVRFTNMPYYFLGDSDYILLD